MGVYPLLFRSLLVPLWGGEAKGIMTNPPESSWYNSDYLNQLNVLRHMQQRQLSAQGDPFRPGPFELSDESDESPQHNPLPQVDRRVSRVVVAVIVAMAVVGATMLVWAVWG